MNQWPEGSFQRQVLEHVLHGKPIIARGPEDREYLEWMAGKLVGELEHDPYKRVPFLENHRRVDGMVQQWRRLDILLYDRAHRPEDVSIYQHGQPVRDWKLSLLDNDDQPVIINVHESRWETVRDNLRQEGFKVLNGDAPWTPPNRPWVEAAAVEGS